MFFPIRSRSGSVLLVVLFISTIALVTFASFHDTVSSLLRIRAISGGAWHMVVSDTLRLLRSDIPSRSLVGGSIVEYSHTSSGSVLYVYSGSTTDIPLRAPGTVNITLLAGAPVRYIQTEWTLSVEGVIQTPTALTWGSTPGSLRVTSLGWFSKLFLSDERVIRSPDRYLWLYRDTAGSPTLVRTIHFNH